MSLRRARTVARARWWLPLALGLLAVVLGVLGATMRNRSIRPVFEANATFPVVTATDGRSDQQVQPAQAIRAAVDLAIEVNASLLERGGAMIGPEQDTFEIVFSARAREAEQAKARAEEMRGNYVIAEFGAIDIESRMLVLLEEAIGVKQALAALVPPAPTVTPAPVLDPIEQARLDFLIIQVDALRGQSARLVADLVLAETGDERAGSVEEVQAEIDLVNQKLTDLYIELDSIPGFDQSMLDRTASEGSRDEQGFVPSEDRTVAAGSEGSRTEISIPDDESSIAPGWQQTALETRYAEIQATYESLFLATLTGTVEELEPVDVTDATPTPIPPLLAGGSGLAGGILFGALLLFVHGRVRKPIWVVDDLAPLPSWEVPVIRGGKRARQRSAGRRRRAIQVLRASVLRALESTAGPVAISMSGLQTPLGHTRQLAWELAAGLGDVERSVLVIDLDFEAGHPNGGPAISLAGILTLAGQDMEAAESELKQVVTEPSEGADGVRWLPAGKLDADPADVLQRRSFDHLLSAALDHVDLVLIIASVYDETVAEGLFQRVDGVVAVCRTAKTRERDLVRLAKSLEGRRADLLGAVLLVGATGRLGRQDESPRPRRKLRSHLRRPTPRLRTRQRVVEEPAQLEAFAAVGSPDTGRAGGKAGTEIPERIKAAIPGEYRRRLAKTRVAIRVPTSRWRGLPDLLVIGTQRGGTSSLYKYLGQHPSVSPSIRKETEYFSSKYDRGEDWYRAHFPLRREKSSLNGGSRVMAFEADPDYLLDPRAAQRAAKLVPEAKIVVLLRDPVARAISHHAHNVRLGLEKLPLVEALAAEEERLNGEVERMLTDPAYPGRPYQRYSYVTRGIYVDHLERWLEHFPTDNFYVARSEDFFGHTAEVYQDLLQFLGLPAWQPKGFHNYSYPPGAPPSVTAAEEDVRIELAARFAPHNQRLYDLLDWDPGW